MPRHVATQLKLVIVHTDADTDTDISTYVNTICIYIYIYIIGNKIYLKLIVARCRKLSSACLAFVARTSQGFRPRHTSRTAWIQCPIPQSSSQGLVATFVATCVATFLLQTYPPSQRLVATCVARSLQGFVARFVATSRRKDFARHKSFFVQ